MRSKDYLGKALWAVWTLAAATPLMGAGRDRYQPKAIDSTPPWAAIMFSVIFLVAVCAPAFKSSNRTHLD